MISTKQYFELAQLAEASYANLVAGNSALVDQLQNADDNMSFSASQATELAAHWSVSAHRPNTASGFSSTLFKSLDAGGGYVLAIRGTEGLNYDDLLAADIADIATDGLALDQIVDLYNEWQRIVVPAGQSYQVAKLVDLASGGSPTTVLLDMPSGIYKTIEFADSTTIYPAGSPYATGLGLNIAPGGLTITGWGRPE